MAGTKLCRKCKSEIDKRATKCPHCQASQTSGCMTALAVVIVIAAIGALPKLANVNKEQSASSAPKTTTATTKKTNFEAGEAKWTYYNDLGYCEVTGSLKNVSGKDYSYAEVTYGFYDSTGAKVGSGIDNLLNFKNGDTWKYTVIGYGKDISKCKLEEISAY